MMAKQEWSDNYALMTGTKATSPQMIDGNLQSVGETEFPPEARNVFPYPSSYAIVTLPEPKIIRRIVIYPANLVKFDVAVDKGNDDWRILRTIDDVQSNPVEVSVASPFATSQVRVRVLATTDDGQLFKGRRPTGRARFSVNLRSVGKIYEIELYGYKTAEDIQRSPQSEALGELLD